MDFRLSGTWALLGLLSLTTAGCTPSLKATCERNLEILCDQIHACTVDQTSDRDNDQITDFEEEYGTDPADCVARMEAGYEVDFGGTILVHDPVDCAARTEEDICTNPDLPNYDAKAASDCTEALEAQSCAEFNDHIRPEPCEAICTE